MYTNIDLEPTINYIIDKIYKNVNFPFSNQTQMVNNNIVNMTPIPKNILKTLLSQTLTRFTSFQVGSQFYQQNKGVSMGGKLSPYIADIFCHLMEIKVVDKLINNQAILKYGRF